MCGTGISTAGKGLKTTSVLLMEQFPRHSEYVFSSEQSRPSVRLDMTSGDIECPLCQEKYLLLNRPTVNGCSAFQNKLQTPQHSKGEAQAARSL